MSEHSVNKLCRNEYQEKYTEYKSDINGKWLNTAMHQFFDAANLEAYIYNNIIFFIKRKCYQLNKALLFPKQESFLLFPEFDGEVADIVVGGGGGLAVLVDDGGAETFLAADEGEKPHLLVVFDGRFAR